MRGYPQLHLLWACEIMGMSDMLNTPCSWALGVESVERVRGSFPTLQLLFSPCPLNVC